MTITLDLPGDVAQRLTHEASRLGLSVDQFVLRAALGQLDSTAQNGPAYGVATHDPYLAAAGARAKAAAQELAALGITDTRGNRLRTDLPADMREGAGQDFVG
ncbi:MAG: hypothetical protein JNL98_25685 [Bryobacterales bacterium]|nr:hypothetical protein [Bryobacterales bacterium]